MKIGAKLFATYLIVLIVGFTVSGLSFHFLSQRYLLAETRKEIKVEGQLITAALAKAPLENNGIKDKIIERRQLKVAGRLIDSEIVVFNKQEKVIYSNLNQADLTDFLQARETKSFGKAYVGESIPLNNEKGEETGHVLIFSKIKDIEDIDLLARRTQIFSFIIAGIFALLIAWLLEKSFTRPINKLMAGMNLFSLKGPLPPLDIPPGDEIGELAHCFNNMADKLKFYDERQKDFLQNTSHELKTPLMSIQGYAEAIKDGVVQGEELQPCLDIIIDECQRLKRVVEDFIYLTRLESIEENFKFTLTNLGEIVTQAVQVIKPLAIERDILIDSNAELDFTGNFDKEKLARAFINILGNCVRYAHARVSIQSCRTDRGTEIYIQDDGPGFNDNEAEKIFDRFYKGDKGDIGLGLAISRSIISGHGGSITANNRGAGGAVFKIFIPGLPLGEFQMAFNV